MSKPDMVHEYLDTVCGQIRWKKARPAVSDELEGHILDQRDALIRSGQPEGEATENAVREMGDAVVAGTMLDRSYRPRLEWKFLLVVCVLWAVGRLMKIAFYPVADFDNFVAVNVIYIGMELAALCVAYFLDFTFYARFSKIILAALLFLCLFRDMRTIAFALLPVASAAFVFGLRGKGYGAILLAGLVCMGVPAAMFWWIGYDIGLTEVLMSFVGTTVVLLICIRCGHFRVEQRKALLLICIPAAAAAVLIVLYCVRMTGYVARKESVGSIHSMLEGAKPVGPGDASAVVDPDVFRTDEFMFTKLIYYAGWLPFIGVMLTIGALVAALYKKCFRQRSLLGKIIGCAAITTLAVQIAVYTVANLGVPLYVPSSGWYAYMPFIRASLSDGILMGVLLSVFRTGDIVRDEKVKVIA